MSRKRNPCRQRPRNRSVVASRTAQPIRDRLGFFLPDAIGDPGSLRIFLLGVPHRRFAPCGMTSSYRGRSGLFSPLFRPTPRPSRRKLRLLLRMRGFCFRPHAEEPAGASRSMRSAAGASRSTGRPTADFQTAQRQVAFSPDSGCATAHENPGSSYNYYHPCQPNCPGRQDGRGYRNICQNIKCAGALSSRTPQAIRDCLDACLA